jgi:pimeloyl-ACP methyl ester carboxylesterase
MTDWPSGDVVANGIVVHYYRTGGDKPPLVLNHGFTDNGLCWTRLALALEGDYDLIMPDARGHGLSDGPEEGYDDDNRAADLAGLIQALNLGRPAVMGHSMGAATTAMAAARYPELVSCIVLEDPAWFDESVPRTRPRADFRSIIALGSRPLSEIEAAGRERAPTWHELEIGPWAVAKQQLSPNAVGARRRRLMCWSDVVPQVRCPALLVTGDPQVEASGRAIVTPELAGRVAAMNPNFRVVRIEGAGHSIRRMQFEPYVRAVSAFLGEVYGPTGG